MTHNLITRGTNRNNSLPARRTAVTLGWGIAALVAGLAAGLTGCHSEPVRGPLIEDRPAIAPPTPPSGTAIQPVDGTPTMPVPATPPSTPPVVTATPPATAPSLASTYIIKKGDTLTAIARAHKVSLKALEAANPKVDPTRLQIGQKITIPKAGATATPPAAK